MKKVGIRENTNKAEMYVIHHVTKSTLNPKGRTRKGDFNRFRQILEKMRDRILTEAGCVLEGVKDIEISVCSDEVDQVNNFEDQAYLYGLYDRNSKLLRKIDEALESIEDGTYGTCEECGEPIPRKRLLARPVTTLCIYCKQMQESMEQRFFEDLDRRNLFLYPRLDDMLS